MRVYLTNVESICRKFCDERRARLAWVREDSRKFWEFWDSLSGEQRKPLMKEKGEVILKVGGGWGTEGRWGELQFGW